MKRLAVVLPLLLLASLAGCGSSASSDPLANCITVNVEYGLTPDRTGAADFCGWLQDRDYAASFNGVADNFSETFGSLDLAREWAKAEASKQG